MTSTTTLLRAVLRPRFLVSAWPWRGVAYTATTAVVSGTLWLLLSCPLAPLALAVEVLTTSFRSGTYLFIAAVLGVVGMGLLAVAIPRLALAVARVERWRLRLVDGAPTPSRRGGNLYTDPATWRAVAYLLLLGIVAPLWLGVLAVAGLLVVSTPIAVHHRLVTMEPVWSVAGRAVLGLVLIPVVLYLTAASCMVRLTSRWPRPARPARRFARGRRGGLGARPGQDADGRAARPGPRHQPTDAA
jgi:hypothetical protein